MNNSYNKFQQVVDAFRGMFGPVSPVPGNYTPQPVSSPPAPPVQKTERPYIPAINLDQGGLLTKVRSLLEEQSKNYLYNPEEKKIFPQTPIRGLMALGNDAKNYYEGKIPREQLIQSTTKNVSPTMLMMPVGSSPGLYNKLLKEQPLPFVPAGGGGPVRNTKLVPKKDGTGWLVKNNTGRPSHQQILEDLWNKKKYKEAQKVIDSISDKYKKPMQALQDVFTGKTK